MSHRVPSGLSSVLWLALAPFAGVTLSSDVLAADVETPATSPNVRPHLQPDSQSESAPKLTAANSMTITAKADIAPANQEISAIQKITISQTEMLRYGDASVSDALRRAAGLQIGSSGGAGKAKFRGSSGGPTILINGEAVQGGRRAATSLIDTFTPEMIDKIEITKQASVTQGSVAAGGVVNIILKEPRDGSVGGVAKVGYGQLSRHQQDATQQQFTVQIDGKQDKLGYSLSANDSQSDTTSVTQLSRRSVTSSNNTGSNPIINSQQTRQSDGGYRMIAPRIEYQWSANNKGSADLYYSEHSSNSQSHSETQQIDSDNVRIGLRLEQKNGQRTDKWGLSGQWQHEQQDTQARNATTTNNSPAAPRIDESSQTVKANYSGSQKIAKVHQLKFGADVQTSRLSSQIDPTLVEDRQALYVEENWNITNQHTLTAGLRQEWLKRSGLIDYQDDSLSPAIAYRYQFDPSNPAWTLQVGYSQSQRSPKTDDLSPTVSPSISADAGSLNNPDQGGNPSLKPESIQAVESTLGYNSADGGMNLTVFRRNIDDYIERVVSLEGTRYVERPQNQAQALATGVEIEGRWAFKRSGGHSLMLNGQLSTIRAEIQRDDQADRLASDVAPYTASLGLSYQYQPWRWASNLNIGYQPAYTRPLDDQPYIRQQNARTSLDLSSTKRFDGGWATTLSIRNLLATDRIEQLEQADGTFYQRRQAESLPNVLLTLEKRF